MKKTIKSVLMAASLSFAHLAYADCTQTNNFLSGLVGLEGQDGALYADLVSAMAECSCATARFQPQHTDTKMALSILLSAKMAGKTVQVGFMEGCDTAYRLYME